MLVNYQKSAEQSRNKPIDFGNQPDTVERRPVLNLEALRAASLQPNPFPFVIIPNFLRADSENEIAKDFPEIKSHGSFPLGCLHYGESFARLTDELCGAELRAVIEEKFAVDLSDREALLTVRGMTGKRDGRIHSDTKSKFVTLLLYLNSGWQADGGRLRILNNSHDLEDYVTEIPPTFGMCVIFKVTDNCWHGHKPFVGERRALQLNYVRDEAALRRHLFRHNLTARIKGLRQLLVKGDQ